MFYRKEQSVVKRGIECCTERKKVLYREELSVVKRGIECCIERN